MLGGILNRWSSVDHGDRRQLVRRGRHGLLATSLLVALAPWHAATSQGVTMSEVTVLGGVAMNTPAAFASNEVCPDTRAKFVGGRLGIAAWPHLLVEATTDLAMTYRQDLCVYSLGPPPPPTGRFERTSQQYPRRLSGYPFLQSGVRVSGHARRGPDELRIHAELGCAWGKRLWVPAAGVSYLVGNGPVRAAFEYEGLWYAVPLASTTWRYQDGVLVSSERRETTVRSLAVRIRVGANVRLRR